MNDMDQRGCIRCGKCCYIRQPEELPYKCRFLLRLKNGHTYCRVYHNRIGLRLSLLEKYKDFKCSPRCMTEHDFIGCPLNTDKEIIA